MENNSSIKTEMELSTATLLADINSQVKTDSCKQKDPSKEDPSKVTANETLQDMRANRELRNKYSFKAYKIVKKSLWGWAILLTAYVLIKLLTKNESNTHGFEIFSDTVLIAITSATTLNIFAAFLSLVKGLFPSQDTAD